MEKLITYGGKEYTITDNGSLWDIKLQRWRKFFVDKHGYHRYNIKHVNVLKHHLVLNTFDRERNDGEMCRHLDGDPANNHISNLKWGTQKENYADAVKHGTRGGGDKSQNVKLNWKQVREIRASTETLRVLGKKYGVQFTAIAKIKNNQTWKEE